MGETAQERGFWQRIERKRRMSISRLQNDEETERRWKEETELLRLQAIEVAARALSVVMDDEKARPAAWWALDQALGWPNGAPRSTLPNGPDTGDAPKGGG
jgi:hypothetical protein